MLNVVFHDDSAGLRTGCGRENIASIKNIVMNLLTAENPTTSLKS
jgi:predicted transposase YbfD/YdcC